MGTIQAQIVGHPGHRDPGKLTREMISYRFPAEITSANDVKTGDALLWDHFPDGRLLGS